MKIGKDYTLRKSSRPSAWERTAQALGLDPDETVERAEDLLRRTPEAISDAIDALPERDRSPGVLPVLHQLVCHRTTEVRQEFERHRNQSTPPPQPTATAPNSRAVLCDAETVTGPCRRRLVNRPCPLHPSSPGSKAIEARALEAEQVDRA